jgi:glycosyltransferase involved in cell wall biosynthesis
LELQTGCIDVRIGFDITALYVAQAGVFTYAHRLLQALLEQDSENEYLLLDYYPLHGRRTSLPGITDLETQNARVVHCEGLRHRRLARWGPVQRPVLRSLASLVDRTLLRPWSEVAGAVMRRALAQALDGVEAFHSSDVLLWKQPGALNVITIHDLTALLFPEHHTANTREMQMQTYRFAQEKADAVIAVSEATKRDILTYLEVPAERVHIVHNGVDPAFRPIEDQEVLNRALAPLGLVPDSYILHVGTIEPRKNLTRLVDAYHAVRRTTPPPVPKLVLAGVTGWQFQEVFERIESLEIQREIVFLGRVPGDVLPALYNGALLFVYPSLYEGFGLPPLEAMACGVPVVASNTSSLPEVVGDVGVLVDPTDTQELAAALASLLGDAERRSELSSRGLTRASLFSWERAARETLRVYRSDQDVRRNGHRNPR